MPKSLGVHHPARYRFGERNSDRELGQAGRFANVPNSRNILWYSELRDKELVSIAAGKNVEEEFDRLYDHEPRIRHAAKSEHFVFDPLNPRLQILVGVGLSAFVPAINLSSATLGGAQRQARFNVP